MTLSDLGGTEFLGLRYRRRAGASGIVYGIESSVELVNWLPEKTTILVSSVNNDDGSLTETIRLADPIKGDDRRFLRLRVSIISN